MKLKRDAAHMLDNEEAKTAKEQSGICMKNDGENRFSSSRLFAVHYY